MNPPDSTDTAASQDGASQQVRASSRLALAIDWLDERTGAKTAIEQSARRSVPPSARWRTLWPSTIAFTFVVQLITGFLLWTYYSPSAQTAWESVYYLQYEVAGGWLLRGVHHYAAQVLVALAGLYVVQMIVAGTYRAPREFVFWAAVLMVLASLGLCLTGDLLSWDQNSYSATLVRTKFLLLLPVIGDDLFKLAAAGPAFGHLTLTRFFALHVGVFAVGFFVLLLLRGWVARRAESLAHSRRWSLTPCPSPLVPHPYWPDQVVRNAAAWLAVMVVVGLLIFQHAFFGDHAGQRPGDYLGVALGAPADPDPANFYSAARPEWTFRALYQLSNMFSSDAMPLVGVSWKIVPIFVIPGILVLAVLAMPFIARIRRGYWINVALLGVLAVGMIGLTGISFLHDRHSEEYRRAVAEGRAHTQRAKLLAASPSGIPVSGALSLLRNDPKTQGPKIFRKQCAQCHSYIAPKEEAATVEAACASDGAADEAITVEAPCAADLYRFASRDWLAGFFDPEKVSGPQYSGNTKFAAGVMARYVEKPFSELDREDQTAIIAALSAEARLPWQSDLDRKDRDLIEKGRERIGKECTRCHRFGEHGKLGDAPDLTGYGTREWIMGLVVDPTHDWFYSRRNDRMPAYLEVPERPEENRLTAGDIALVTDWLRREWYEPSSAARDTPEQEAKTPKHPAPMFTVGTWVARRAKPTGTAAKPWSAAVDTPLAQARALFQREHCAICHDFTGMPGGDMVAADPSAPDLGRFASREWLAGLLDPDQIRTRKYFGNSKFRSGDMADFVKDTFSDMDDGEKKELQTLIIAVSAEAQLPAQREADQQDAERIKEGRQLVLDVGCTDCHRFHGEGTHVGPDLTGYGSTAWLKSFLCDPVQEASGGGKLLFYDEENYGMPSYRRFRPEDVAGESPEDLKRREELGGKEKLNLLTAEEIQLLVDTLRGEVPAPGN